jgi:PD-(D/E)XK nuclease superfamily
MADNLFQVLGIQSREDCVSNAMAYAFNASEKFRRSFLDLICGKRGADYAEARAHTRISAGIQGVPDIVLVCQSGRETELIIIENKLRAEEGNDQTERYASPKTIETLRTRLCPDRRTVKESFVFLTLFPDQEPKSRRYATKQYKELSRTFGDYALKTTLADSLMYDWLSLVQSFYSKEHVAPGDLVGHIRLTYQDPILRLLARDRPAPEIEITSAMIEAATDALMCRALDLTCPDTELFPLVAGEILAAALRSRR